MKRLPNESYEHYRARRVSEQRNLKAYLRGQVVWYSRYQGPYRRGMQLAK